MTANAGWVLLFVGYFAMQAAIRSLNGLSLQYDEAEALYEARRLAWGYGPQPPLYFWMQWLVFQMVGVGLPALALLKNALLAGAFVGIFGYLRGEATARQAGVATLALGLMPSITWEAQRALTHSVLAFALAVAAIWLGARALERGRWRDYAALGVCVGLGTLAKLTFLIWAAALLVAAVLLPEWRLRLDLRRTLAAVLVAAAVTMPGLAWMVLNPDLSTSGFEKLEMEPDGLRARIDGTLALLNSVFGTFLLTMIVLGVLLWRGKVDGVRLSWAEVPARVRFLALTSALAFLLLWIGYLVSGSTDIKQRWLLPFAWGVVPGAVILLWPALGGPARRRLALTAGGLWLFVMTALPLASYVDPRYRRVDHGPLAERLAELGAPERPLAVTSVALAGNLVHVAPGLAPIVLQDGAEVLPEGWSILLTQGDNPILQREDLRERGTFWQDVHIPERAGEDDLMIVLLGPE